MRIGIFTDCYKPIINGVVTSIETTVGFLNQQGHEVYVFAPGAGGKQVLSDEPRVVRFASFTYPFHREQRVALPLPWGRFLEIGRLDLDVIHLHTPFSMGLFGRWWAVRRNIPSIFSHHTHFEEYVHYAPLPAGMARRLAVAWARTFCRGSRAVIAPSGTIKKVLEGYGVTVPIVVLPTPIEGKDFQGGDPGMVFRRFPRWGEGGRLLYVGRLGKEKGMEFLLDAFRLLRDALPGAALLLVGDGPYRREVEEGVRRRGLDEAVWWSGYVPREELRHYYAAADLLLFASLTETQGLVVAEALSAGCPVVAVDAPGVNEILRDRAGGRLVPADPASFAAAAADLLQDRGELGRQGALAAKEVAGFSREVLGRRLEELYERVRREVRRPLEGETDGTTTKR